MNRKEETGRDRHNKGDKDGHGSATKQTREQVNTGRQTATALCECVRVCLCV